MNARYGRSRPDPSTRRKPNFFIVGAPKCGTTAVSRYLRTHPNVFFCSPKEPHYFSPDLSVRRRTLDQYLDLFASATPQHRIVGEASTAYMASDVAIQNIKDFDPDAKILVMLRNPTDLLIAFHNQMILNGYETELDCEKAWHLQGSRVQGKNPPPARNFGTLQYKWIASIGQQTERVFRTFPRHQVHVILLDDLAADPRREYTGLLAFLGLPDDSRTDFPRENQARSYRVAWLSQIPWRLRHRLDRPYEFLWKIGFRGFGLLRLLDRFNVEHGSRRAVRPEFRAYLDQQFADEISRLEKLLGLDLSHWRHGGLDTLPPPDSHASEHA